MKYDSAIADGLAAYTIERRFTWERHRPDGAPPWDEVRTMWARAVLGEMDELNGEKSALLDLYNQRLKEAEGVFGAEPASLQLQQDTIKGLSEYVSALSCAADDNRRRIFAVRELLDDIGSHLPWTGSADIQGKVIDQANRELRRKTAEQPIRFTRLLLGDQLASDVKIAALYDHWYQQRDEIFKTYSSVPSERLPLSQNPEFKAIRNAVVKAALEIDYEEKIQTEEYKRARELLYGTDDSAPAPVQAKALLLSEAAKGNVLAMFDLGLMARNSFGCARDDVLAQEWFHKALAEFIAEESRSKNPGYWQYRIGKMYATLYGIEKYLGSGLIKGVGPRLAKQIVAQFGLDTIDIIENAPDRLIEIPKIGRKRVERIKESWERQKEVKNVMPFLQSCGVTTGFAAKIYKVYGSESIGKVKGNPYCLADGIWGIGFKTADKIAESLGFDKESYVRCRSGLMYTLNELADEGHTYAQREQLVKKAVTLLDVEDSPVVAALEKMLTDNDLILDEDAIYLPPFYYAEQGTANKLLRLIRSPARDVSKNIPISDIERHSGLRYDETQKDAIQRALSSKVMVLTGGPGTGKTTVTQGIIEAYCWAGLEVLLAAPTGRAAKRMTETTGLESKTIHRLLEFKPPEGYQRNEENPLEGDALIVDECSMIDVVLMNSLLKALSPTMRLILVGDIDQLPSVGPGNVLRDIIASGCAAVVKLTKIFRQAQSSRIIMNAHRINGGKFPDISNGMNSDFFFLEDDDPEHTASQIVDLVKRRLPKAYHVPPGSIQVLTPMQRGVVGATNLNILLQNALNPAQSFLARSGLTYRLNDKVMQIKNNYEKDVFNGDIGIISKVDVEERTLAVQFDGREIEYDSTELDELTLAYAATIHKSQGPEYPIVVMPVLMTHYVMLQRNMLYTGITRAKKLLVLIGTKQALHLAVRTVTAEGRNTRLRERLEGCVPPALAE